MKQTDILILGSGIARLAFAIQMAERKPGLSICVCTKSDLMETNTRYAQGGIAVVTNPATDSFEQHIRDTLDAGKGYCDENIVNHIIKTAPDRLAELARWGVAFDPDPATQWALGLEGGHSQPRIVHCKDHTGLEIERALLQEVKKHKNIKLYTQFFALDLLVQNNECCGMRYLDRKSGTVKGFRAKITCLATGGSGQVFKVTTNPLIATGDGVAMAARAGAGIKNMRFYQFHPTALANGQSNPAFLISEAVRGAGAHIINAKGERFLFRYDPRGELATRDIVSHAIFSECAENEGNFVYLDCRHLDKKNFYRHFPGIITRCLKTGYDVFETPVPVTPAAHYQCGGITVNRYGQTSVKNLYANGECACTGLHGANRLASNSLLEAVVMAHEAAEAVSSAIDHIATPLIGETSRELQKTLRKKVSSREIQALKKQLQALMYQYYTGKTVVKKSKERIPVELEQIDEKVKNLEAISRPDKELYELKNMVVTSSLML